MTEKRQRYFFLKLITTKKNKAGKKKRRSARWHVTDNNRSKESIRDYPRTHITTLFKAALDHIELYAAVIILKLILMILVLICITCLERGEITPHSKLEDCFIYGQFCIIPEMTYSTPGDIFTSKDGYRKVYC